MNFYDDFVFEIQLYIEYIGDGNPVKAALYVPVISTFMLLKFILLVVIWLVDFQFMTRNYLLGLYDRLTNKPYDSWEMYKDLYPKLQTLSQEELKHIRKQQKNQPQFQIKK